MQEIKIRLNDDELWMRDVIDSLALQMNEVQGFRTSRANMAKNILRQSLERWKPDAEEDRQLEGNASECNDPEGTPGLCGCSPRDSEGEAGVRIYRESEQ